VKERESSYEVIFDPDTGFQTLSDQKSRAKKRSVAPRSYGGIRVRARALADWVIRGKPGGGEGKGDDEKGKGDKQREDHGKKERETSNEPKQPPAKRKRD
jgi:hypothetical protein